MCFCVIEREREREREREKEERERNDTYLSSKVLQNSSTVHSSGGSNTSV